MDILKNLAAALDRDIDRKRLIAKHHARVEELIIENAEALVTQKWSPRRPDPLDWDYEPSGYQGETNGEFSA
jgi:hypothetical protein